MFGMGISLEFLDFIKVWKHKRLVVLGVLLQYTIMPILALGISFIFQLPKEIAAGIIIVGACPGGTSSNVMSYIAKANLALSVTLTLITTFLAPLVTPLIIYLCLQHSIDVPFFSMVKSVFWIVMFPLVDGLVIRYFFYNRIKKVLPVFPSVSILSIILIIACVVGLNQSLLLSFPIIVFIAVAMHNCCGLGIGYFLAKFFGADEPEARTIAFEVGLQNSGLGVSLATQFFTAAAALPGSIFSLWHNLSGIFLAKYWLSKK